MKTRIITISILILTICITSCAQTNIKTQKDRKQTNTIQIDTSIIAIFPFDKKLHWIFKDGKTTTLTKEELLTIENILKKCISNYNPNQEKQFEKMNKEHSNQEIPQNAISVCGAWWAGAGDYFYIIPSEKGTIIYQGWEDEM